MTEEFTPRPNIQKGIYRHYKGNEYELLDVVCHSETLEWLVLYKRLYKSDGPELWVRPASMFVENVTIDGKSMPRFEYLQK
jgi:hypothetical protein